MKYRISCIGISYYQGDELFGITIRNPKSALDFLYQLEPYDFDFGVIHLEEDRIITTVSLEPLDYDQLSYECLEDFIESIREIMMACGDL